MSKKDIFLPLTDDVIASLRKNELIYLSGTIYSARDAAHKILKDLIKKGKTLPFDLKNQIIYYSGPILDKNNKIISFGPTTSKRMDDFTLPLLKMGVSGFIGKGNRSQFITKSIKKYNAIYFCAVGGCGALYAKCVKKSCLVAYPELGSEAIIKYKIDRMPLFVSTLPQIKGDNK